MCFLNRRGSRLGARSQTWVSTCSTPPPGGAATPHRIGVAGRFPNPLPISRSTRKWQRGLAPQPPRPPEKSDVLRIGPGPPWTPEGCTPPRAHPFALPAKAIPPRGDHPSRGLQVSRQKPLAQVFCLPPSALSSCSAGSERCGASRRQKTKRK